MVTKLIFLWMICAVILLVAADYVGEDATCSESSTTGSSQGCGCNQLDRSKLNKEQLKIVENGRSSIESELLLAKIQLPHLNLDEKAVPTELLTIPGGQFTMGTNNQFIPVDGEGPARQVIVPSFFLQKFEVSNRQFADFVLDTGYVTDAEKYGWSFVMENALSEEVLNTISQKVEAVPWWLPVEGANWLHPEGLDSNVLLDDRLNHPVLHVSYSDAEAYCTWLGLRLPREAEFEKALKGGTDDDRLYPWGNDLTPNGEFKANLWQGTFPAVNTKEDGFEFTAPVDSFGPQNDYGLYNIIGNVWEWVADAWVTRHDASVLWDNPQFDFPRDGSVDLSSVERTKRGGSFLCHKSYCYRYRIAARSSNSADSSSFNLGIRCAGDLEY